MRKASVTSDANGRWKSALRQNGDTGCRNQRNCRQIVSHRRPMCAQHGGERMLDKYKHDQMGHSGRCCVSEPPPRGRHWPLGVRKCVRAAALGRLGQPGRQKGSGCLAGRLDQRAWTAVSGPGRRRAQGRVRSAEFGGGPGLRQRDGPAVTGAGRLAVFRQTPR